MILISCDKRLVAKTHTDNLETKILKKIEDQKKNIQKSSYSRNYKGLLNFFIKKLKVILSGDISKLKEIVLEIERKHFISSKKLKLLKYKREKQCANVKNNKIYNFINQNNLSNYLHGPFKTIKDFNKEIDEIIENRKVVIKDNKNKDVEYTYEEALEKIFDYEEFSKYGMKSKWNAYKYTELLGINVCPYCDKQFVHTYISQSNKKSRAVLDHFYSKSLYPYLGISIFNLIPCCHICNSTYKLNIDLIDDEMIYPFEDEFNNNINFIIKSKSLAGSIGQSLEFDIDFEIISKDPVVIKRINRTLEILNLKASYNNHKVYVKRLLRRLYVYNTTEIERMYDQYFKYRFGNLAHFKRFFFNEMNIERDLGEHVLSKLTLDIIKNYKQ